MTEIRSAEDLREAYSAHHRREKERLADIKERIGSLLLPEAEKALKDLERFAKERR